MVFKLFFGSQENLSSAKIFLGSSKQERKKAGNEEGGQERKELLLYLNTMLESPTISSQRTALKMYSLGTNRHMPPREP